MGDLNSGKDMYASSSSSSGAATPTALPSRRPAKEKTDLLTKPRTPIQKKVPMHSASSIGKGAAKPSRAAVNMIKKGLIRPHGEQAGAYVSQTHSQNKRAALAQLMETKVARKVLPRQSQALAYSKAASMKTRR